MAKRLELLIASGQMEGARFAVGPGGLRLGRSSLNDVHIPDEELSRNHCLFEPSGEGGIRVTDLASANGTFVNGEQLGSGACELKAGDMIELGATVINVVSEGAAASPRLPPRPSEGTVDLGLGAGPAQDGRASAPSGSSSSSRAGARRRPLANILWVVAALAVAVAIAVVLVAPRPAERPPEPVVVKDEAPRLVSLSYEKVEADGGRIFRYHMAIDGEGVLRVAYDDVPGEDRHVAKKTRLSAAALKRVDEILRADGFTALEDEYTGSSVFDENALKSYRVRAVYWNSIKDVLVENAPEPDAFRAVREALEAFSRNELGIWAIQYSRDQLLKLSDESMNVGDAKWDDRSVEYGNLNAAIKAYKEALFYLETINPKPDWHADLKMKLERTETELRRRYEDQRFLADRAINLGNLESAQAELKILCELVPDKDDPRHVEASARLVDVENRMKKTR